MVLQPVDHQIKSLELAECRKADVLFGEFPVASQSDTRRCILSLTCKEGKGLWLLAKIKPLDHQASEVFSPVLG